MGRMSDLEKTARDRLKFKGIVTMVAVGKSELESQGLGVNPTVTSSSEDLSAHIIKYTANVKLEDSVFFHEFSHLKLNEVGLKRAEATIEEVIDRCCTSTEEVVQMTVTRMLVAETLTDAILYRFFRSESEDLRNHLDYSFLMTDSLRNIDRRLGVNGIVQAAGYRVSKKQAGLGDSTALGRAIHEAFGDGKAAANYDRTFEIMSRLPQVGGPDGIRELDDAEIQAVVRCVLDIFEVETGKKCA
jgi:hypothetical protein